MRFYLVTHPAPPSPGPRPAGFWRRSRAAVSTTAAPSLAGYPEVARAIRSHPSANGTDRSAHTVVERVNLHQHLLRKSQNDADLVPHCREAASSVRAVQRNPHVERRPTECWNSRPRPTSTAVSQVISHAASVPDHI